jgi:hypothetical protein
MTTDHGETWKKQYVHYGYENLGGLYRIISCGENIFASGNFWGIRFSSDYGVTWRTYNEGIDTTDVSQTFGNIQLNDNYIYYVSSYAFRMRISNCEPVITGIDEPEMEIINTNINPNPASDYIILPHDENGSLPEKSEIYNVLGEKVFEQDFMAGSASRIDVSGFSTGVYYLVYLINSNTKSQRFIISR